MQRSRAGRIAGLLTATVLAALVAPGIAQAHHTAVPIVALDYSNRISAGPAEPAGVRASLEDAGRKLRLTVAPARTVTVAGYLGEPFLRFDASGVYANPHSETAQGLRLVPPGEATTTPATWTRLTRGHSLAWADARSWAPSSALHGRPRVAWSVPITVDGRRTAISGELTRAAAPAIWPWAILALLPLLGAAAAARRKRWLWVVASVLAAVAGAGTLANLSGFATGGLPISADRWTLFAIEVGLTIVALGFLVRPRARLIAVAALAAFSVLQSLSALAVFRHGIVVSGLPAAAVRLAAALALGSGLGAGGLVFLAPTPGARRRTQTRSTVPYVRHSRKEQA
ncbi:MAG TPA: hypothetical protein VLJ76_06635 [Gaiellaceae bacterium]|nr:hypothetical protein [Gaiellaceae bacterium]